MQWKILVCSSSLWTRVAFFLMHPCFVCDSLSSQGICFIPANNKMNYLFSHHDPGLLEEGPSLGEKEHPQVCCTFQGKRQRFLLSCMVSKKNVYLFFDVGRPQLLESMQSRVHLIDYANLISFTIDSSLPKLWDCKWKNSKNYIPQTIIMKIMTKCLTPW